MEEQINTRYAANLPTSHLLHPAERLQLLFPTSPISSLQASFVLLCSKWIVNQERMENKRECDEYVHVQVQGMLFVLPASASNLKRFRSSIATIRAGILCIAIIER